MPLALLRDHDAGERLQIERVDIGRAHQPRQFLPGRRAQRLEAERRVTVLSSEQVRELPDQVKEVIGMVRLAWIQERKLVREVLRPRQQVEVIVRGELRNCAVPGEAFDIHE